MTAALFTVGFSAVIGQVLLIRELVATFYGNELLYGLILGAWLAWGAAGSAAGARTRLAGRRAVGGGLALAALLLPVQLALVRGVRSFLGVPVGALVEIAPTVAAVLLIPAPLCALLGSLFALAARLLVSPGGGARAYLWESTGAVVGGALFSFVLVQRVDPLQTALLVGVLDLTVAVGLLLGGRAMAGGDQGGAPPRYGRASALARWATAEGWLYASVSVVLLLCAVPLGRALHMTTLAWQWSDLVFAADSPYGRLTVVARDGQRAFFENGTLAFETESTFPEEVVHFPLLVHPNPRSVLMIGGGVGGGLREALLHPVQEVVYVEQDPTVVRAAHVCLPEPDAAVLDDPRLDLVLTDGRRYVQTSPKRFDVVILNLPEPSTGALNRFYTQEFFASVQSILSPGGLLSLGLPSAENYWNPALARRNSSVYWSLREVFPYVLVLPGDHNFFLASDQPLVSDPAVVAARMAQRGIQPRWVTPAYVEYVFTTDRFLQVQAELEATARVRRNYDWQPVCYYYELVVWLSRFYPALGQPPAWPLQAALAGSLVAMVGWARWRRQSAVPLTVMMMGWAQMALEVAILFAFQVAHGTLYSRVSLVVTAFMAGLVAGAYGGRRLTAGLDSLRYSDGRAHRRVRGCLMAVLAGVAATAGLIGVLPKGLSETGYLLLVLAAGGLGGTAFPLALAVMPGQSGQAAGLLYAADLAGGCLGAPTTATLLIPLLGLDQTLLVVALLGVGGLLNLA